MELWKGGRRLKEMLRNDEETVASVYCNFY